MMSIGVDIGGANLKISDGIHTCSEPFPLWRSPELLASRLSELLGFYSVEAPLAVTMTGELADCFTSKAEGVGAILDAVEQAAGNRPVRVWQTGGEFFTLAEAREFPGLVAAANWHALATWAGRMAPHGLSLVVDIGSTTTDIIPLRDGLPATLGNTDLQRMAAGELLYFGIRRTPVCSIVQQVMLREAPVGIARELFATMHDVALLTGLLPEERSNRDTADGRPACRQEALSRLARMVCADRQELEDVEILAIAGQVLTAGVELVSRSLQRVLEREQAFPQPILLAGEGESLARRALRAVRQEKSEYQLLSVSELLGSEHSQGACAYALSRLSAEWH